MHVSPIYGLNRFGISDVSFPVLYVHMPCLLTGADFHLSSDDRPPLKYRVKSLLHHLKHANATAEIHADIVKFRANVAFELSAPRAVTITQMSDFLRAIRHMVKQTSSISLIRGADILAQAFDDSHGLYMAHLRTMYPIVQVHFPEYFVPFPKLHDVTHV